MTTARTFRMTIATKWYDEREECVQEYEIHFKTARLGKIRNVRRYLAKRGVEFFQKHVYEKTGKLIPKGKIRIAFEKEEPARKAEKRIKIEMRKMRYRGRKWKADRLPSKTIPYTKKRPKRWKIIAAYEVLQHEVHALQERVEHYVKRWFKRLFGG